jgi:Cu2+-exporting ATPase
LAKLMPGEAHKIMPDGNVQDIPVEELSTGDQVVIKPGEKIPADGNAAEGETSVNEAMLTGESKPVVKKNLVPWSSVGRSTERVRSPWR